MDKYADIIALEYKKSTTHKHMSLSDRAAEFQPFAALTGYSNAIKETARITKEKITLSEDEKIVINEKLILLNNNIKNKPEISLTYFVPDNKKSGGRYLNITSHLEKIDLYNDIIILTNNKKIPISDIINIS